MQFTLVHVLACASGCVCQLEPCWVVFAGLRTIPTFGVLFPHTLLSDITTLPSLRFNPMMLLHGEQELVLPVGAIPTSATVTTRGRITNIFDKGRGAVVIVEAVTSDMASGAIVCVNR